MTFLHEWTHGFVAWLAGYKSDPFDIRYSSNWLTLWGIDEAVPYRKILADGKNYIVAIIAIAPIIEGAIFFLVGLKLLSMKIIQNKWMIFSFFYWWTLMEISEIYSYIPVRTFAQQGDIFDFLYVLEISPWVMLISGTPLVIWGLQRMLIVEELRAYDVLQIENKVGRFIFLFITLLIVFLYFGGIAFVFVYPKFMMNVASWVSLAMIPLCLIFLRKRYVS